ncbi:hypothetical protein RRG08_002371 [Elysia crispata]|uniref:Uncharacterized protein n=1 Tax=Elysia crispata TaxID=231223 RepID=A0AAE1B5G2_9GAST|nr:hypothetical protein RRG08_002371 [Elysia crispata]
MCGYRPSCDFESDPMTALLTEIGDPVVSHCRACHWKRGDLYNCFDGTCDSDPFYLEIRELESSMRYDLTEFVVRSTTLNLFRSQATPKRSHMLTFCYAC